jgi:hypothetical protein
MKLKDLIILVARICDTIQELQINGSVNDVRERLIAHINTAYNHICQEYKILFKKETVTANTDGEILLSGLSKKAYPSGIMRIETEYGSTVNWELIDNDTIKTDYPSYNLNIKYSFSPDEITSPESNLPVDINIIPVEAIQMYCAYLWNLEMKQFDRANVFLGLYKNVAIKRSEPRNRINIKNRRPI